MNESPSKSHNRTLAEAYIAAIGTMPRYPKVSDQIECLPLDTSALPPFAYNPSIWTGGGKTWFTYRYHFAGDFRTRLGMAQILDGVVTNPRDLPIEGHSVEDARLFWHQGELWLSWVESDFTGQLAFKSVVKYARMESPEQLKIGRAFQPDIGGNVNRIVPEKNWCFFDSDENLFCVYIGSPHHTVMQLKGALNVNETKTPPVSWPYGPISGGNVVPYDGKLLRFFHSKTLVGIGKMEIRYYVGVYLMERRPPFKVLAVSRKPILYGSELPVFDTFHFKGGVVFPGGAIANGDSWTLAVGINDAACALVKVKPENLNL